MTQEEIIKMAQAAGLGNGINISGIEGFLERFFHMAQAAEREACAKVCDELVIEVVGNSALAVEQFAEAIRARGQQ